jgi:hypothetical protein
MGPGAPSAPVSGDKYYVEQRTIGNNGECMKKAHEPTYSFVILTFILIIVNTLLAWLSVRLLPVSADGVSIIYIAVAFMILFTLWFGAYGAIAAYVGTLLGGILATPGLQQHPEIALFWAVAGLIQVLIPLVAVRVFEVDLSMESRRDWTIVLLFGVLINNVIGAAWGAFALSLITSGTMASIFSTWLIGNIIVTILIVPASLRFITGRVRRSKLYVKNYFD